MREPGFWRERDLRALRSAPLLRLLLTPLSEAYVWAGRRRLRSTPAVVLPIPVICIGNLTLGGAGKTPVAAAVRAAIRDRGLRAGTLSRGYRGRLQGPLRVDPEHHTATDVGDEPLMLSLTGESWIARERAVGAGAMSGDGVDAIVMDDGHQNPTLRKTGSIVVIDASDPFGNDLVFPKGPLREPVEEGLSRADLVVLMGDGAAPPEIGASGRPMLRAHLAPVGSLAPGNYVAFAGIGRPERFFDFLRQIGGVTVKEAAPFADHHAYSDGDIRFLRALARDHGARLVTTQKDFVRLPAAFRPEVDILPVEARFDEQARLEAALDRMLETRAP